MATGLGALTEGFQSGYKFSRKNARDKIIDKALDFDVAAMSRRNKNDLDFAKMMGQDIEGYDFQPESWGSKLMGKIKGVFSQPAQAISPMDAPPPSLTAQQQFSTNTVEADQANQYAGGMRTAKHGGMIARYAHGGSTRHMVKGYAHGGNAKEERMRRAYGDELFVTEEEAAKNRAARSRGEHTNLNPSTQRYKPGPQGIPTSGGGVGEFARDVGRSASNYFDDTIKGALGGDKLIEAADAKLDKAKGAREIGRATRETGAAALTAAGETTAGFLKDTLVDNPITQGVMGFFGRDGKDEKTAAVKALPTQEAPEETAKGIDATAAQPAPAEAAPGSKAPPSTVVEEIEQSEDPIIDMSQVREIRPDDMPNKGMKEWQEERNFYAYRAHINGEDPLAAMVAVDAKQMRGFTMYGQQAFQLLRAGNAPAAVNALYAAYQYFPNGVDVRFGVMKGKDGEPVIIGMGTDEKTGEPNGKPTVITAESLAVQIENMSNPAAFKAWTKDWRDTEQAIREYNEVTKQTAQSNATYRAKAGDALLLNAQSRLQEAMSSARGGGLKQSDYDRAFSAMSDDADTMALFEDVPPDEADYLKSVMAVAYRNNPGNFPRISQVIKQAYREGGIAAVDEMVGGGGGP